MTGVPYTWALNKHGNLRLLSTTVLYSALLLFCKFLSDATNF